MGSLNDLGHDKKSIGFSWSIFQRLLVRDGGTNFVNAGDVYQRHGMRGRFDMTDIELIELLDVAEDLSELRAKLPFFSSRQGQAGEVRHIFHVQISCSHRF